jgi:hypothetical protein
VYSSRVGVSSSWRGRAAWLGGERAQQRAASVLPAFAAFCQISTPRLRATIRNPTPDPRFLDRRAVLKTGLREGRLVSNTALINTSDFVSTLSVSGETGPELGTSYQTALNKTKR